MRGLEAGMLTPEEQSALLLSVKVSVCSVAATLPLAVALAWLLARRAFPGKALLEALLHLPLVLPPVVVGYVLLLTFGRNGWLGVRLFDWFGVTVAFTWKGAAIAAGVMGFPLMVQAIRLSMAAIEPRLEQAASTLGSGPWRVFFTVTLPLSLPGIIAGTVLGFARGLGEFGATITFVGNILGETRTLPLAFFTLTQTPGATTPPTGWCGCPWRWRSAR
ncbi:molybdate ABC transporter permease subunit [Methylogaea oryzae]|uniref:molybdate ABC transporter permease subunit n=1 Tax=Methylogaea oryzae TaxID=1295382 RepID=UPI0020CFFB09|nr:molybdate ABC transporter permease subunit [Methylogaea oryzae]